MAAEGSINTNLAKRTQEFDFLNVDNFVIAGKLKVKHTLIEKELILVGFVVHEHNMDIENFKIRGMTISYWRELHKVYGAINNIIYPKILVDNNQTNCSEYFKENKAYIRDAYNPTEYNPTWEAYKVKRFNYYLFKQVNDIIPESATNEILYAVCKYFEDNKFTYLIIPHHELTAIVNQ